MSTRELFWTLGLAAALTTSGALVSGCSESGSLAEDSRFSSSGDGLIYGSDDRLEWYQLGSAALRDFAEATAGVLDRTDLTLMADGSYRIYTGTSFASSQRLCSTEPYRSQPASMFCTAFRVGEDLVATAGHCVDAASCGSTAFVFGFRMEDESSVRAQVPAQDVYRCSEVVARQETNTNDYAVVRVDRAIVGHPTLRLRRSSAPDLGTPLVVAGHPSGIPLKVVADNAVVRDVSHPDYFSANVDTYGGNSGSPVVNAETFEVEGILVRGNTDFVYDRKKRCYTSNVCPDSGCPGWEDVTRAAKFAAYVPELPVFRCTDDAECDDLDPCNGAEVCELDSGACLSGPTVVCDDLSACTDDFCQATGPGSYLCATEPVDCSDGDVCTDDVCDAATGCAHLAVACDDGSDGCCSPGCELTDPDCAVPVCANRGEACSENADCCLGLCDRRRGTCKK